MKKLILIIATIALISCENKTTEITEQLLPERELQVVTKNGTGFGSHYSYIDCDRVEMIDNKTAFIWIDGNRQKIVATHHISVHTK